VKVVSILEESKVVLQVRCRGPKAPHYMYLVGLALVVHIPASLEPSFLGLPTWSQVFTSRSFVAKLFLAASDVRRIQELDAGITQCMIDIQVPLHRPPYGLELARRTPTSTTRTVCFA
jgi:hypothetical protein